MKVLITGTSQGIGKAIAEIFLERGHSVIGIDRLAILMTGQPSIQEVLLFPTMKPEK